jgi:hypothetical protein
VHFVPFVIFVVMSSVERVAGGDLRAAAAQVHFFQRVRQWQGDLRAVPSSCHSSGDRLAPAQLCPETAEAQCAWAFEAWVVIGVVAEPVTCLLSAATGAQANGCS